MRRTVVVSLLGLMLLALILVACEGYTESGGGSRSQQGMNGGLESARADKANGSIEKEIEVEGVSGLILDADVTLSVEKGTYKIELIGEDGEVTLALEASDGESVSGQGWMAVDTFGEANYRVTATEAENVEYSIEYTYR
jgi:hypothetical protein